MKADIWMPLYIGDYLADTARLTTEQHGAYLLLIMDYWRSGKLPDDDRVLAQICKMSLDAWSNARASIQHYFSIEDGFWVHSRIEAEKVSAETNKGKKTEQARNAAKARWSKDQNNAQSNAVSNAGAMLEQCPSPSPSPSKNKTTNTPPDGVSQSVWDDFVRQRKAKKASITDTAIQGIEREAKKANMTLNDALQEICARGWTGFKAEWVADKQQVSTDWRDW
jgi:uncharacterized protein YdaU (DUF1376 family)